MGRVMACQGEARRLLRGRRRMRTIADPELPPGHFPALRNCKSVPPDLEQPCQPPTISLKRWVSRINGDTEMYAVIVTGGKQYKVAEGEYLKIEKLEVATG